MHSLTPSWSYEQKYNWKREEKLSKLNSVPPNNFPFCPAWTDSFSALRQRRCFQQRGRWISSRKCCIVSLCVQGCYLGETFSRCYQIPWQMKIVFSSVGSCWLSESTILKDVHFKKEKKKGKTSLVPFGRQSPRGDSSTRKDQKGQCWLLGGSPDGLDMVSSLHPTPPLLCTGNLA